MYAITSLLVIITLSLLVTRVASVIFTATGLDGQTARFQARSALSGTGFTSSESEEVLKHPVRRRVVMALMLLGNAGIVASAGSLILGFRSGSGGAAGYRVLVLALGLLLLVYLSRNRWIDRRLTRFIGHFLRNYTDLTTRDLGELLDLAGPYSVSELHVDPGDWVAGRAMGELGLRDEGIAVLGISRRGGGYLGAPAAGTRIDEGDTLVLYGTDTRLEELDGRKAGEEGQARHRQAVLDQQRRARAEAAEDTQGVAR